MKLQFVDGRVEVWSDEAIVVNEYVGEDGVDVVEYIGGWVKPNEYQAEIIKDTLITALQGLQEIRDGQNN